jgi:hypothetical protein
MAARRWFVGTLAAAVGLLCAGGAAGTTNFPDSTGENSAAPDIVNVKVSDDRTGLLTFRVDIKNRPLIGSCEIVVGLDADNNATTGRRDWGGIDYAIHLSDRLGGALGKWTGSQWDWGTAQSTFVYSYAAGAATFTVNASELGNTKAFKFYAAASDGDAVDVAPDRGQYFYSLSAPVTKTAAQAAPNPKKKKKK